MFVKEAKKKGKSEGKKSSGTVCAPSRKKGFTQIIDINLFSFSSFSSS